MSQLQQAIVWIDHQEAKVCRFSGSDASEVKIHSHTSLQTLHHRRGGWEAGGNPPEDAEFFHRIAGTLDPTGDILVTGPGNARSAFKTYLARLHPEHASQVFTLETTAALGDEALLALGRAHFAAHQPAAGEASSG